MNVVLYGPGRKRWALTERGRKAVTRDSNNLVIGPSSMRFDGSSIIVSFDEMTMPIPGKLRGQVRLTPSGTTKRVFGLDAAGRHRWWPIAPASRAEITLTSPDLRFSGPAYFDMNEGSRPLEADFDYWNWSRAPTQAGAAVLYDVLRRDGSRRLIALDISRDGEAQPLPDLPVSALPKGPIWQMPRETRTDPGGAAKIVQTFEDTPFYTRSQIETRLLGETTHAIHESLSMPRFTRPWVQAVLPFRMPRAF